MNIDPHTLRHLVYCKSLYMHAISHSDIDNILDRAIALLNFDNSIEMLMYTVLEYRGAKPPRRENFYELLKAFEKAVQDIDLALLYEVEIMNMHRARNNVQHHGIIPSADDIERYKSLTLEVLSELILEIFQLDFNEVSLGTLIKDDVTRTLFNRADKAYFSENYEDALTYLTTTFEYAKNREQGRIYGSLLLLTLFKQRKKLNEVSMKLVEELEILKLRLDYKKYQKYREIFSFKLEPFFRLSSNEINEIENEIKKKIKEAIIAWKSKDKEELRKNVVFCSNFVIENILKWEAIPRKGWLNNVSLLPPPP